MDDKDIKLWLFYGVVFLAARAQTSKLIES